MNHYTLKYNLLHNLNISPKREVGRLTSKVDFRSNDFNQDLVNLLKNNSNHEALFEVILVLMPVEVCLLFTLDCMLFINLKTSNPYTGYFDKIMDVIQECYLKDSNFEDISFIKYWLWYDINNLRKQANVLGQDKEDQINTLIELLGEK